MENKKSNVIYLSLVIVFVLLIVASIILSAFHLSKTRHGLPTRELDSESRNYHILVTGTFDNQLFLQQVYEGAQRFSDQYNAIVELYVPGSQAEDVPLQALLDYASYVNADGVIAFNDLAESIVTVPHRTNDESIPFITTGLYNPNIPQVSYIGTSYWELGKKISTEINSYVHGTGNIVIFSDEYLSSNNYANLMNSLLDKLHQYKSINYTIIDDLNTFDAFSTTNLIVCLSEQDTIKTAQKLMELEDKSIPGLLGFGTNETCQLYLEKGIVSELIDVDAQKIGETALKELFEYRTTGYANSYIAADVKILRKGN